MVFEYRTYDIYPHLFARYCELARDKAIPIRKDDYGRLIGFWASESGMLCQVHHIWLYDGVETRNSERARMVQNNAWMDEFIAHAWPTMQAQRIRFMYPRTEIITPETGPNLYEARVYKTVVGRFAAVAEAVAARPKSEDSVLIGVFTSEAPSPNEVVEIVARPQSLSAAERIRDPKQAKWFAEHGSDLVSVQSTLLSPLSISPMA